MSTKKRGTIFLNGEGTDVGDGQGSIELLLMQQSIDLAQVANVVAANQNVSVTGLLAGDVVVGILPAEGLTANVIPVALGPVSSNGTLVIRVINPTAAPIDPAAAIFTFVVLRGL